jgi:hypothetical protein
MLLLVPETEQSELMNMVRATCDLTFGPMKFKLTKHRKAPTSAALLVNFITFHSFNSSSKLTN